MFYGTSEVHRELPGFSVSLLSPQLRFDDVPLHTHPNASFVLVLKGRYLSSADGPGPLYPSPTLFFNPAGTTHRDSFELASGRFLAVSLSQECLRTALTGGRLPGVATALVSGDALETARRLARQSLLPENEAAEVIEGLCWELLSNVAGEERRRSRAPPGWLRLAREILLDQCNEPLRMTALARQLGVHPVHLARAFRSAFHCTPGDYLARCRVGRAVQLLRTSGRSLADVALAAGFFDQSHLSRSFQRHLGITPQAYRRSLGQYQHHGDVQMVQEVR
jgi:AraC family transcriptional regulator